MKCSRCGTDNMEGVSFCTACGMPLSGFNQSRTTQTTNIQNSPQPIEMNNGVNNNQQVPTSTTTPQPPATNGNRNNKVIIIGVIVGVLLLVLIGLAVYFLVFHQGDEAQSSNNSEQNGTQQDTSGSFETTVGEGNDTVTFIVQNECANNLRSEDSDTLKSYYSDNIECLTLSFIYNGYNSAQEDADFYESNPIWEDVYDVQRYNVTLNNGVEVLVVQLNENMGAIYYPLTDTSNIEIDLSAENFSPETIQKYIVVKE